MELRLLSKKKKKPELELNTDQKLALIALQKQKQVLELKEWLVMLGFIGIASLLRIPMQVLPNVEPLTFFAILAGWLFGRKKGFLVGVSSIYISNFLVFGGQGPWTFTQVIAYGLIGFLGGFLRKKSGMLETMLLAFVGTMAMQIILNIGWAALIGFNFFAAMLTALPFTIVHVLSNTIFAAFLPKAKKVIYDAGKFNEKELCDAYINNIASRLPRKSKAE